MGLEPVPLRPGPQRNHGVVITAPLSHSYVQREINVTCSRFTVSGPFNSTNTNFNYRTWNWGITNDNKHTRVHF